jgi:hypothetical protein
VDDGTGRFRDDQGRPVAQPRAQRTRAATARPTSNKRGANARKARAGTKRRTLGRMLGLASLSLIFVILAAGMVGYVRLLHGGISLDWARERIAQALEEDLGGARLEIQGAQLLLEDGGLAVHLTQSTVRESQGQILALISNARAQLSWSAFKRGRLAVSGLDLVAPRLLLTTTATGRLAMSVEPTSVAGPRATGAQPSTNGPSTKAPSIQGPSTQPVSSAATPDNAAANNAAIDLVKLFTDLSAKARRRESASGFLRQVGIRDAVLIVTSGDHRNVWNVPEARIDLSHKRDNSSVRAQASIATLTGPLTVTATTNETNASDQLVLDLTVDGLNPRGFARMLPGLGAIETIDLPLAGSAKVTLSTDGQVRSAAVEAAAAQGMARFGLLGRKPVALEATRIALTYDGTRRAIDISDLTFGWAGNKMSLAGQIIDTGAGGWTYALRSTGGTLAARRAQKAP